MPFKKHGGPFKCPALYHVGKSLLDSILKSLGAENHILLQVVDGHAPCLIHQHFPPWHCHIWVCFGKGLGLLFKEDLKSFLMDVVAQLDAHFRVIFSTPPIKAQPCLHGAQKRFD